MANAKPVVIDDLSANPRAAAWRQWAAEHGYRAAACTPLIGHDHVLGVLNVFFDDPHCLGDGRSDLLQSLANLAAIALSEAQAKEQIRRSQARVLSISSPETRAARTNASWTRSSASWIEPTMR